MMPHRDARLDEAKVIEGRRIREASGRIDSEDPLVGFLYLLARDYLPLGTVEDLIGKLPLARRRVEFTNGWLASWAKDAAHRLRQEPHA